MNQTVQDSENLEHSVMSHHLLCVPWRIKLGYLENPKIETIKRILIADLNPVTYLYLSGEPFPHLDAHR